jgi:hypothetical protein
MTRKLRNSLQALLLTATVCTLGAVTLASLPLGFDAPASPVAAAGTASTLDMDASELPDRRKAGKTQRMRPSLGMPYFSFVPRG